MSTTASALFVNESMQQSDGTYTVGIAEENKPGWVAVSEGWASLEQAQQYVAETNGSRGLSAERASEIVTSSMAVSSNGQGSRD